MKILTEYKLSEIKLAEYKRGEKDGRKIGWSNGYTAGERNGKLRASYARVEEKIRAFDEAAVIIESIELVKDASVGRSQNFGAPFTIPKYKVKFRSKSGNTPSNIILSFGTPDFSMGDVRRKITEEFCGGAYK